MSLWYLQINSAFYPQEIFHLPKYFTCSLCLIGYYGGRHMFSWFLCYWLSAQPQCIFIKNSSIKPIKLIPPSRLPVQYRTRFAAST